MGPWPCRNHPFEVARIEAQARGDQNQKDLNIAQIFRMITREQACAPTLRPGPIACCAGCGLGGRGLLDNQ